MIGVSVSHMATTVAKTQTMLSFFLILEMHCVWTPFGDGGPSALWKSQRFFKKPVAILAANGLKYIHLSMLWKIKGSLVVTCVHIDLPISSNIHGVLYTPASANCKAINTTKAYFHRCSLESKGAIAFYMFFYHRICLAKLGKPGTQKHCSFTESVDKHTPCGNFSNPQNISTTNRDGGWFYKLFWLQH